ncbi:MAG TPA: hypothetical protein DEH78_17335, partial [Solibacterales bacterium]|nr:hypothetical protein [Bryobacterales bacterium]
MRFAAVLLAAAPAFAAVTGVWVETRADVSGRRPFGLAGPYERIEATVRFAIDPANPANRAIVGLDQAPRNGSGMVEFSADLTVYKPSDPRRGNGTLLVDIVNRGSMTALAAFQFTSRAAQDRDPAGDGFLFEQGFTVAAVGWQYDLKPGPGVVRLDGTIPGLGFAAARDVVAYLKRDGSGIHLLGDQPSFLKRAMGFGVSQSGRF